MPHVTKLNLVFYLLTIKITFIKTKNVILTLLILCGF